MLCPIMYSVFCGILVLKLLSWSGRGLYSMYLRAPAERSWVRLGDVVQLWALPAPVHCAA